MNIVLCGMMGVGKTATSQALQRLTGRQTVDTDAVIVSRYGRIADIFAEHGEAYFRSLEEQVVKELSLQDDLIIATGGGCVLRQANVQALKAQGKIFFLTAPVETLLSRVAGDTERPLLVGDARQKMTDLLQVRMPVYTSVADHVIDTDGLSPEDVARQIVAIVEAQK